MTLPDVLSPLAPLAARSDLLGWAVLAAFVAGWAADVAGRRRLARYVTAGAWGVFAVFWLAVFPHFLFEIKSAVEGIGSLVAVPASLYTGYLLLRGRDSLLSLSRAVTVMGLVYYPTQAIPVVRRVLIETVAKQTLWGIHFLGYHPEFTTGPEYGYQNMIVFDTFATYIVYACTGMGSIAIFAGLIAASNAPVRRKLRSLALATGVIWFLNIVRNVFVAIAAGKAWFHFDSIVQFAAFAGVDEPYVSFWFSHTVIAQLLSVVALVGITYVVVHQLPEMLSLLEEVLFVATGTEYDLQEELGIGDPVAADGGRRKAQ